MKILQTQTLQCPNYWSIHHSKLILVRLDLEELAERPSNTLREFHNGLAEILPSLENKEPLSGPRYRGGFLSQVREGITMGHILERVALELQTLADMPVGFGRSCETATPGIYQVVIEYQNEETGRYATRAALRLCQSIVETGTYPKAELEKDLDDLKGLRPEATLGASTEALVREDALTLLGKDGRFEGEVFIFQQTQTVVDVHLKDGTPVYTDSKLNLPRDS